MQAERWKQIDAIFDAVLEREPARRGDFLTSICGSDADLLREVESLLASHDEAADFIETPALETAAKSLAENHAAARIGVQIAHYQIKSLIGAGGMGEVYLAADAKLNRLVALKILPSAFAADAERIRRFQREAETVSTLNHPNIVTIFDVGCDADTHFIAVEYVDGKTLREILTTEKLTLTEILKIVCQTCDALGAAHAAGIIHRDIKPENIMRRTDGIIKVLDFGLAKLQENGANQDFSQTNSGLIVGTLNYISPEQALGWTLDNRTDLWSLGIVFYEMLIGKPPFTGATQAVVFNQILNAEPVLPAQIKPELPIEIDEIMRKALEKDRELSYQTAHDIRADARRLLKKIDSGVSWSSGEFAPPATEIKAKPSGSNFKFYPVAAAAILILAAIGALIFYNFFRQPFAPDWARATHLQLTDAPGTEYFPVLAPDGKSFAFASDANGNLDIFVQRVGGKNADNLTADAVADDTQPAFSPDGERIAFRSEREPSGIYLIESTGENLRRVADFGFHPSWSPDGKEIVVSTTGRDAPLFGNTIPSQLWIINAASGEKRMLTDANAMQPAWSPNGARVAFWFMPPGSGKRHIGTISRDGGEIANVVDDSATNWNPVWSPDGNFLYFISNRGGNTNFWRTAIDQTSGKVLSAPEAVVTPSKYSRHLNFSRDGKRLIYVQSNVKSNVQSIEFDAKNEKTVGAPVWITRGDREILRPELSPDGKQFVVNVLRRTQEDIVLMNRDGSNPRDLTTDEAFDRYPRWSPDGKKIAFNSDRTGNYKVYTINADGTNLRQVVSDPRGVATSPLWSPDNSKLYIRYEPEGFILNAGQSWEEQSPRQIPSIPNGRFVGWDWSPDGKKIIGIGAGEQNGIAVYSFETNDYKFVFPTKNAPMWLADSRRFVISHEDKAFLVDTETGKSHALLSQLPDKIINVRVSRDDKLLYYVVQSSENDVWLLNLEQ